MIYEEEDYCLEQWCLYVHRLKSGFSKVDLGPLFIHDSWPPTVWAWILLPDSSCFQLFLDASCYVPHRYDPNYEISITAKSQPHG